MDSARAYQQHTKYRRGHLPAQPSAAPPGPKRYAAELPRTGVPRPEELPPCSLWEAVAHRRSVRTYTNDPIVADQLALLLWATQGITTPGHPPLRATPSAGGLYPLETYLVASRVEGIEPGLYHLELPGEQLVRIAPDADIGSRVAAACLNQHMCADAACVFLWTAVLGRTLSKYGERGLRYVYLDAGHVGQNLQLAATACGLGSCNVAALFDDEVNAILGVDGESETIVYAATVGVPKE